MRKVYLDNAACTPLDYRVKDAMLPYLEADFGNPSSLHSYGLKPKDAVEKARQNTADLISSAPEEIIFTSNGSESNNFAVKGTALSNQAKGKHLIISEIEHFSVMHSARTLEKMGFKTSFLPVDEFGIIKLEELLKLITDETIFISVMHANHEIGTIQPIEELTKMVKIINSERLTGKLPQIFVHTDAVQTTGNININVKELGVDLLSLSGTNFYGPKGAAALYVKKGIRIAPLIDGGIQEGGRRAGLENVPAIAGLGKAAEIAKAEMDGINEKMIPSK